MYDIRQFKPALYVLLLMGVTGFAMAAQTPGLWILAVGGILLNTWLIRTDRFTPMPRLLANAITVLAMFFVLAQFRHAPGTPILIIGQFLVILQLIKLYEQRANRDYAQLLVLSLLLMVAAAITTASLLFGILFIAYLFLSLYCCLLFHLKVETDEAKKSLGASEDRLNPNTLRQDQRYLSRSMRRLTGLVSIFALSLAVIVFLFFPRGAGAGLFGQFQFKPAQALTGFSDQVSFQQVARITQSDEIVAYLQVFKNDKPLAGDMLYLRGLTLDVYNGEDSPQAGRWQWTRSVGREGESRFAMSEDATQVIAPPPTGDTYRQVFQLKPTGTGVLFALAGPTQITVNRRFDMRYAPSDSALEAVDPLIQPVTYTVVSSNEIGAPAQVNLASRLRSVITGNVERSGVVVKSTIDPKVREFALRAEVSGSDAGESLAARRLRLSMGAPLVIDEEIARNFERYLQKEFTYTLDLTDAKRLADQDPMVAFLYDLKRGHCEYFAGAMALMCQSIGMEARVVVGFKCGADAYNALTKNYIIKQAFAHAWVEVLTPEGWKRFDPTSGREAAGERSRGGVMAQMQRFFDYLEYTWANNVVAYDTESRDSLISNVETKMTNTAMQGSRAVSNLGSWIDFVPSKLISSLLGILIGLMVLGCLLAVGWFLFERWKMRRRAARIGIDQLPASDQVRLVRQLGFYDDLLRLLERQGIVRPKHQTPLEFGESLSFVPAEAYREIRRLTRIYNRIRFGDAELDAGQRRRLNRVISEIEQSLTQPTTATG